MPKRRRLSCSNQKKKRTKQVRPISKDGHWEIERVVDVSAASTVPTSNLNINKRQHWVCLVDWKGNDFCAVCALMGARWKLDRIGLERSANLVDLEAAS